MKNIKKLTLLILGILVATFTLLSQMSFAGTNNLEDLEREQYQLVETIITEIEKETNTKILQDLYKIYNNEHSLVYETRNDEDQKLNNLLNKSDLLTTINNISYYKLSR
ncbi:MAG: hypothetical protein KFF73_11070 [Cyclobacteriaceae bacterium]|nr:hypothetical protein [Cyclobacteriaceae bacterium]